MRLIFKKILLLVIISNSWLATNFAQVDTTIFTYSEYLENVVRYHPVAKQAALKINLAEAEWLSAKGNLDPELTSNWSQKNFDDLLYYRNFTGTLRVPTVFGIDFVGGYENNDGVFLNPENKTDKFGLWNVGVEVNVLQGLIVNERKIALQQAKIFQNLAENQRQIVLNELIYGASLAYLDWQQNYYAQQIILESIELAETYFDNTKRSYFGGEKTAMDTLEALLIYQDAQNKAQFYEGKRLKAQQNLENFLWFNEVPLELENAVKPEFYTDPIFEINTAIDISNRLLSNPIINEKLNKQAYFEAEQRLKREKLKPKLKAKYNPLLATADDGIAPSFTASDYKWGFEFSMPLFLRSERAGIQMGEIKLQDIALDIDNKRNELLNKTEASRQQQVVLQTQLTLMQQNVEGYRRLLEGENDKFLFGESSVFLLNKRQEKYIDGRLKLVETFIKMEMERLQFLYLINGLVE